MQGSMYLFREACISVFYNSVNKKIYESLNIMINKMINKSKQTNVYFDKQDLS